MTIRRASLLLPCRRLDDFPTHLTGEEAAELLAAWTALWHPSLIHATGRLPGWHPADDPPDPAELQDELVVIPSVSRQRLAGDWCDRLRATAPGNPPPVEAVAARQQTIDAALAAASIAPNQVTPAIAADFLALGYAHLQVELLTRAMRYTPVLDDERFGSAVVAAARAAVGGDNSLAHEELGRAFDLLADARNHVYATDFYVIDLTLLAPSTLGDSLRAKLASASPTNLLVTVEIIERMAREQPALLEQLRQAVEAGTACVVGGRFDNNSSGWESPESLLAELKNFQQSASRYLGRECEVFGQFNSSFSLLMPEILAGLGFKAALHVAFDGGRLPRAEQCKTRWGQRDGPSIEALSASPLDVARPETWLTFAERVGDSIAHDFVATVLVAGWPGQGGEYYEDLRRAARFDPVLGKLVTLEEYFRITRETDDWTTFLPAEYPAAMAAEASVNPISSRVCAFRRDALDTHQKLGAGLVEIAPTIAGADGEGRPAQEVVVNPWNFTASQFIDLNPLDCATEVGAEHDDPPLVLPDVPGCGYAVRGSENLIAVPLVDGHTLRNETLELTVSATTGGIQSLRTHRDRGTRVSQRLVFQQPKTGRMQLTADGGSGTILDTQMVADEIHVARNDTAVGEITSRGGLLDAAGELLARYTQSVRLLRALPAAIVEIQLETGRLPMGDLWSSYFASRLAWSDEAVSFRRGVQWSARESTRQRIESPEWVEVSNGAGNIVCFGLGLPCHRRTGETWLDTLLVTAGEERRFQFALGLDCDYPVQTALGILAAGRPTFAKLPGPLAERRGWFLHVNAKNVLMTHCEPLGGELSGVRCRLLETEGRNALAIVAGYRPFRAARLTDFRSSTNSVLSIVDGQVSLDIGPHRWVQLEAEW